VGFAKTIPSPGFGQFAEWKSGASIPTDAPVIETNLPTNAPRFFPYRPSTSFWWFTPCSQPLKRPREKVISRP